MKQTLKAHLLLVAATVLWGFTFLVVKSALRDSSPLAFNAARMAIASVVLAALFFRELRTISRGALWAGCEIGTTMWLGYEFQTAGLQYTTASKSAFLTGLCVVLVPLLLAVFWRRHVNRYTLAGVAAATVGLYLLCVPAAAGHSALTIVASLNRGDMLSLACALAFAFQIILVSRSAQHYHFSHLAPVEIISCTLWMAVSIPLAERHGFLHWTPRLWWALGITSLLCTVACFIIQNWAQKFTPPTHAALIYSLEPVFAALASYAVLGERLGTRGALGAGLMLTGVLASEVMGHVQQPREELAAELGEEEIAAE